MDFFLTSDTAGAYVGELVSELRQILYPKIEKNYSNVHCNIGVVIRCLPDSYHRKSFTRYMNAKNDLTIDLCVSLEEYEKLYKIEQRFELGKIFLEWLNKGFLNNNFLKNNPDFNKDHFINDVVIFGKEEGWFFDEVDYSQELNK